jgi:hypothetical protein
MFSDLTTHLSQLRDELTRDGFSEIERAAILGAESRAWHLDMKVMPVLEHFLRWIQESGRAV